MKPQHRPAPTTAALSVLSVFAAVLTLAIPSLAQDRPASPAAPPAPIYVDKDATGLGDGSSWENACLTIHDALARIVSGEIWVAEGVYYPDEGFGQIADDPTEAFRLEQGVEFYGGFDPSVGDIEWEDRDPVNNVTVLSGDIDQNDTTGIEGRNSYHVVTADDVMKAAVMDGFTITAGSADSDTDEVHCQGGGIRSEDASPTLDNLIIQGNRASCEVLDSPAGYGGGMYNIGGSPYFSNITFQDNYAGLSGGGLYYTTEASDLGGSITSLTFIDNEAGTSGGGMSLVTSLGHSLSNLTFEGNSADESGGGLYVQSDVLSTLSGSWLESNTAPDGGGVYLYQSLFNLSSTTLLTNDASSQGGGIFSEQSQYSLSNVTLNSNDAGTAGGGIFANGKTASISGSNFLGNTSVQGGGMYVDHQDLEDAALTIQNGTLFADNVASEDGGGIYVVNSPEGTLSNTYFVDNEATTGSGGGLFLGESGPYDLSSVEFSVNRAVHGGGMYVQNSDPSLTGVSFDNNQATSGGGIYLFSFSDAEISDTTFAQNTAVAGGGMYINDSDPILTNIAFNGNEADGSSGGGLWNDAGAPTLRDVLFSGNRATLNGGGMRSGGAGSNVTMANATFSGNAAGGSGGGMYTTSSNMFIRNTVIWNNQDSSGTDTQDASIAGAVDLIEYSLIQNYALAAPNLDGTDPLNDPQFVVPVEPASAPTKEGVLSVRFGSPIVDAGSNAAIAGVSTDLADNPRIYNGTVDLGVYELQLACAPIETTRLYVDRTESLGNNGVSWEDALPNLRDALTLIAECDGNVIAEVWVAKGIYRPDEGVGMVPNSRAETYQLIDGVAVYGGFAGTELSLVERNWVSNLTVLSGDVDSNDVAVGGVVNVPGNIYGANSYHVVIASGVGDTAILDGFTITAGQANGNALDPEGRGAGIYNDGGSATLANLTFIGNLAANGGGLANLNGSNPPLADSRFENNMATLTGGGIYNEASSPTLTNLVFTGNYADNGGGLANLSSSNPPLTTVELNSNTAGTSGGGIYNEASSPTLTTVQFKTNAAGTSGGGIYNMTSSPTMTNTLLSGNSAPSGAAIYNDASTPTLINTLLSGNFASTSGAAIYNTASSPSLVNVTVAGNRAAITAGGMYNAADSDPALRNTIFWDNWDASGIGTASATIYNGDLDSVPFIGYSLVQSLSGITHDDGGYNLNRNPWFATPLDPALAPSTAGDFTLWIFSPAIDAGDNAANTTGFDLSGDIRVINDIIDLGPYEAPFVVQIYDIFLPIVLRTSP